MNRLQKAHSSLTGLPPGTPPQEFPDVITLPDVLHAQTQHALAMTEHTGREQWAHANRTRSGWKVSDTGAGSAIEIAANGGYESHTDSRDAVLRVLKQPHFHLHTHPTFSYEHALMALATNPNYQKKNAAGKHAFAEKLVARQAAVELLPSAEDVSASLKHEGGTVANMIASAAGSFLSIKHGANEPAAGMFPQFRVGEAGARYDKRKELAQKAIAFYEKTEAQLKAERIYDPVRTQRILLMIITAMLSDSYVSYVSLRPDQPTLHRVDLRDPRTT